MRLFMRSKWFILYYFTFNKDDTIHMHGRQTVLKFYSLFLKKFFTLIPG